MFYAIVAVIALILDQMIKYWTTVNVVENTGEVRLIPGLIHMTNVHNSGAAFGMLRNAPPAFFVVLCLLFVALVVYVLLRDIVGTPGARWCAVIIMAGAVGNCVDRVITGYVVDMFEFEFIRFPVFNVADVYITLGAIAFCLFMLTEKQEKPAGETVREVKKPETSSAPELEDDPLAALRGSRAAEEEPFELPEETSRPRPTVTYTRTEEERSRRNVRPAARNSRVSAAADRIGEQQAGNEKTEQVMRTLVSGKSQEAPTENPAQQKPDGEESYDLDDILAEFRDL